MWRSSRDSARTPVQWDATENAGFTTGEPWFYVNENYTRINAAAQEHDPDSLLNFYRKAIALRKSLKAVRYGTYRDHFPLHGKLYVYSRETEGERLLVVCSFSDKPTKMKVPRGFDIASAQLLLGNYENTGDTLQPYECRVYRMR